MLILTKLSRHTETIYQREFTWTKPTSLHHGGFSFPCTQAGVIDRSSLQPEAIRNLDACLSGLYAVTDLGVTSITHSWVESAVGICEKCGLKVSLHGFTNTCICGTDYNLGGARLAAHTELTAIPPAPR